MAVIYILWLRQIKRYLRSKERIIGSIGQPLLFLVALGFGIGPIYQKAGGGNYVQFIGPGVTAMGILFTSVFSGIEIIWDKQFGFLKETLVAPVSRFKIMLGRTLGGATVAMIQGTIIFILSLVIGMDIPNIRFLPLVALFMFLTAIIFTALGTAIASVLEDMQGFQLIVNFLIMPLFFLSGALFPLDGLPGFIKVIVVINPLSYGVDGMRSAITGVSHFGMLTDFSVLAIFSVVLIILGGYLFSRIEV